MQLTEGGRLHLITGIWATLFFQRLAGCAPSKPGGKLSSDTKRPACKGNDIFAWRWSWAPPNPTWEGESSDRKSFTYQKKDLFSKCILFGSISRSIHIYPNTYTSHTEKKIWLKFVPKDIIHQRVNSDLVFLLLHHPSFSPYIIHLSTISLQLIETFDTWSFKLMEV